MSEIRDFLVKKYGEYVVNQLLTQNNEVINNDKDNCCKSKEENKKEQKEIMSFLKSLKDKREKPLIPEKFFETNVEWGVDFSSWIGEFDKGKDLMIIGSEPHISVNYQLVYNFGNYKDENHVETALSHYNRRGDIWHHLTNIFISSDTDTAKSDFLSKCYITDLCHIVPKRCGQITSIRKALSISKKEWVRFRTSVAKDFLIEEIKIVNPKYIILQGANARDFVKDIGGKYNEKIPLKDKHYIRKGQLNGYEIIAIPHLTGNEIWRNRKNPKITESAKRILNDLIKF